jgi:hypothetical protein
MDIVWKRDSPDDPDRMAIYFIQNSTQFVRQMAINVNAVSATSYTVPPFQDIIPNGHGYQIMFVPMEAGSREGALSGRFDVLGSNLGQETPSSSSPLSTNSTSSTSFAPTNATPTMLSSPTEIPLKSSTGLSTRRKIGIGIGVVSGTAALAGLLLHRQKGRRGRSRRRNLFTGFQ